MVYVGIDVSKAWLDVAVLDPAAAATPDAPRRRGRIPTERWTNTAEGCAALARRLTEAAITLVAVEATGACHARALTALLAAGLPVCLVNPVQVRAFRTTVAVRNKTDRADAILIARYGAHFDAQLERVHPALPAQHELRSLVVYREGLIKRQTMLANQRHAAQTAGEARVAGWITEELAEVAARLAQVDAAIAAVLTSMPEAAILDAEIGVGLITVAAVLAYLPPALWGHAKAAAAYAGVHPAQHASGTSSTSRMSKHGHAGLRRALYCAALPAIRFNPVLRAYFHRLIERGKTRMQALGAVMHKLLRRLMGRLRDAPTGQHVLERLSTV